MFAIHNVSLSSSWTSGHERLWSVCLTSRVACMSWEGCTEGSCIPSDQCLTCVPYIPMLLTYLFDFNVEGNKTVKMGVCIFTDVLNLEPRADCVLLLPQLLSDGKREQVRISDEQTGALLQCFFFLHAHNRLKRLCGACEPSWCKTRGVSSLKGFSRRAKIERKATEDGGENPLCYTWPLNGPAAPEWRNASDW